MLISSKLAQAFSQQVGNEMGASMQYVAIASYFDGESLPELAKFFFRQADEEHTHSMKFVHFLNEADGKLTIPPIPAPKSDFASAEEAIQLSLSWEQQVTQQIYDLVNQAKDENNYIAQRFLDWFVTEQLEEVSTMSTLLAIVHRAGPTGLLHVEDYLARTGVGSGTAVSGEG